MQVFRPESFVVYGVFDSRNGRCRYVGMTTNRLSDRIYNHRAAAFRDKLSYPICYFFRKHGCDAEMFVVLEHGEQGDHEHLQMLERFWIAQYRDLGEADLNIADGGGGVWGLTRSAELRAKQSEYQSARWKDPEFRSRNLESRRQTWEAITPEEYLELCARRPRGSAHVTSKLTEGAVSEILQGIMGGKKNTELALEHGVTASNIQHIKINKTWKHVPRPEGFPDRSKAG